jgi:methyl-accepting chemotaxis protein
MALTTSELRNRIIGSLEGLSSSTERVYMGMAEAYPKLLNEMRQSLNQTEQMLHGGNHQAGDDSALLQLIKETRGFIDVSHHTFAKAHKSDQEIHSVLASQLERVSSLSEFINHIHDDSSAMELISLNAMTVALKAGIHGRAFSVITEELQRLSARTIDLTEQVTMQGEVLIRRFSEFKEILNNLNSKEEAIFGAFIERINACFEDFSGGVKSIIRTILDLRKRSEKVIEPLMRIMTEIQNQDVIRQGIDHVILSLHEIKPITAAASPEETLDEFSFLEILPDLCRDLLDGIAKQIRGNKETFETNLRATQGIIDTIEREREQFIRSAMDDQNPQGLLRRFQKSHEAFEELFRDIESLYRNKANTVNRSREVQYMVKELDSSFKSFENLITRFRTIDIASRIEIAKQAVLAQMSGTVNEMTALTLRIQEDVAKSDQITSSFLETSQRLLEQYRRDYLQTSIFSRHFIERLRKRSNKLETTKDSLIGSINNNQVFTGTFIQQFNHTRADLESLENLLAGIDEQKRLLQDIKAELGAQKRQYMNERGIADWKLDSGKLRSMIERFTIFTHKQIAGELGGFTVEQGIQSGDVTFF